MLPCSRTAFSFFVLAGLATACGKTSYSDAGSPAPRRAPPAVASDPGYSYRDESAAPTTAPAPAAARAEAAKSGDGAFQPTPSPKDDRPGLGTAWGEARQSRGSSAPFERQDWDQPLTTTSFFYNDESGVRAMLGSSFWERRTSGVSAARGAITVRVVDDRGAPLPTFSAGLRAARITQAVLESSRSSTWVDVAP